jgi:hypothetical protein
VFGTGIDIAFQSVFRLEIHQNIIFLKFIFDISISKRSKNKNKKNLKQKKFSNFFKTPVQPQDQIPPNSHG